jgi:hypothetical protein
MLDPRQDLFDQLNASPVLENLRWRSVPEQWQRSGEPMRCFVLIPKHRDGMRHYGNNLLNTRHFRRGQMAFACREFRRTRHPTPYCTGRRENLLDHGPPRPKMRDGPFGSDGLRYNPPPPDILE